MAVSEIDSFVCKFKYLWHVGFDANLKVDTNAGNAWVTLQAGLGRPSSHPFLIPHQHGHDVRRSGPARRRRRERREADRRAAGTNEETANGASPAEEADAPASVGAEEADVDQESVAGEASTEEVVNVTEAACDSNENAAAEATDYTCDLCETKFNSNRALRTHEGRMHKIGTHIPQLDGQLENLENSVTYTFVSEFAVEDIQYTLREIFPHVETNLLARVKLIGPWSADHLCTVEILLPDAQNFSWPEMSRVQAEVLMNIQKQ